MAILRDGDYSTFTFSFSFSFSCSGSQFLSFSSLLPLRSSQGKLETVNMPHQTLTRAEVAKNNTEDSLWFVIDSKVYDVTGFLDAHPGGESGTCFTGLTSQVPLELLLVPQSVANYQTLPVLKIFALLALNITIVLKQVAGTDATEAFYNLHRQEVLQKYSNLVIGTIEGEKSQVIEQNIGDLSVVPYGEPTWLTPQFKSPYYNESHRRLQKAIRVFTDQYVTPVAQECEKSGETVPQHLIDRMSKAGILHMRLGPGKHLHGVELLGGAVKGEEFDYFHDMIVSQELVRVNARGFQDGNMAG